MQQLIFIADLIACSTCFGHHYAHHQEFESIIQVVAACRLVLWFSSCRYGVELRVVCPVCGLPEFNVCRNVFPKQKLMLRLIASFLFTPCVFRCLLKMLP